MSEKRSFTPLILGITLIFLGVLFLAANVYRFDIEWLKWIKFVLPAFLVLLGALKLIRHFAWDEVRLLNRPGRAGLLSGFFFLSIGVVWILDLADVVRGFEFFGLYWPFILVFLGLGKIVDYYRFGGRLRFRAPELLGVLFIMFCGFVSGFVADAHLPLLELPIVLSDDDLPLGEILGKRYEWSTAESIPAGDLREIQVSNLYGNIRIRQGKADAVEVSLTKEIFETSEEKARQVASQVQLSSALDGPVVRIGTNREDLKLEKNRFKSHLNLTIPGHMNVKIANGYGDVRVAEIGGSLEIKNSYGEVVAETIAGQTVLHNRHDRVVVRGVGSSLQVENYRGSIDVDEIAGPANLTSEYDSITARRVQGDVSVKNRFGSVRVQDVQGSLTIAGPGSQVTVSAIQGRVVVQHSHKSLTVTDVGQDLEAESSYSQVRLSNIGGPVDLKANHATVEGTNMKAGVLVKARGSQVSLTGVVGSFDVATSLREVSVKEFENGGKVMNEYGEVFLSPAAQLREDVSVASKNGRITVRLPSDASFRLSAQAPGGSIQSDFGERAEAVESEEETPVFEQIIGAGGPLVRLQTTHALIRVVKD